jgi:hypothetical protein
MIKKSSNVLISAATTSVPLILIAFVISYFVKYSLEAILFVIGGIPIIIFFPGLFSSSIAYTPELWSNCHIIYRIVDSSLTSSEKTPQNDASMSRFNASLSWVIAGLIIWIISYFV